jgi:para-nitrobenzyl esterase
MFTDRRTPFLLATTTGAALATAAIASPCVLAAPRASIDGGVARGAAVTGGYAFRGLPYAAAPTGEQRWRPPRRAAGWKGVRDATRFAPSCPQTPSPSAPPGAQSEDCLYLNVSTPTLRRGARRPVIVWIHGGGLTQDGARNYDATKLAAGGAVVVTINYRLGALGFLAHPALASRPDGAAGNYGLMDQRAALRWVRRNIGRFGGDPRNVTIAGQSAGGLSVLAQLVSPGSRGLFERAIVQSGAFALKQQPLTDAEAAGKAFATKAGCPDQTAGCLRKLPLAALLDNFPGAAIPGVIDGAVLRESIGTALAAGRFARVPVLDGINDDEELIFTAGLGTAVSGGTFVPLPEPVTAESYERDIAAVQGVSTQRAAAIAAGYPLSAFPVPAAALSVLVSDANFACPALALDRWTSARVPTFAYQFNDDNAPQRFAPPGALPPVATHSAEIQYLFDQPNAPFPGTLDAGQQRLAARMRAAWTSFAAGGNPSTTALRWPSSRDGTRVMSLVAPQPRLDAQFAATHHCSFWTTGGAR